MPAADATTANEAAGTGQSVQHLLKDGFVRLPASVPAERITAALTAIRSRDPAAVGDRSEPGDDNFRVGPGRYTMPVTIDAASKLVPILLNPTLVELLDSALHDAWVFEAVGVITAFPGAERQQRHRDGGLLFPEKGLDLILPPTALTIVFPLVVADEQTGMTTFFPGSHRRGEDAAVESVSIGGVPGDCVVWDFRVFHLGEPNLSEHARPLLYITCCRPFWIDHRNFELGQNAKLLITAEVLASLEPDQHRRFARAKAVD